MPLNIFYAEPDPDRWIPFDRYPRRVVRRMVRGRRIPGGHELVFINLVKGLKRLGVPVRINDFRHARRHPQELACIVGKPQVLLDRPWVNPVLFGASVFSHPLDCPDLFDRHPVRRVLVPGEWVREMFEPHYGDRVKAWPVGIDTDLWAPDDGQKTIDCLVYDKVRWERPRYVPELIEPVVEHLRRRGHSFRTLRYGSYAPAELRDLLRRSRTMIFLCEHETQGLAYQQALSCDVPVFAWDRGGPWQDPTYYPRRVRYAPVTSVPYWSEACGMKFRTAEEALLLWDEFWGGVMEGGDHGPFRPRAYVLDHLTLTRCAEAYMEHVRAIS